jgi:hypothetical protein
MKSSDKFMCLMVLALVGGGIYCLKNKKEGYANVWYNKNLDNTMLQRPTFNANLDPNNPNMRFDPNVYGGFIKGASPPTGFLAANNLDSKGGVMGPKLTIDRFQSQRAPQRDFQKGVNSAREGFTPVLYSSGGAQAQSLGNSVYEGTYQAGMNDAASFDFASEGSNYNNGLTSSNQKMMLNNVMNMSTGGNKNPASSNFDVVGSDFAYLATAGNVQQQKMQDTKKYKASLDNSVPNTLEYTLPSELLPTPDMRQPLMRDPSDPSNFMYDRTVFAPLKSRNLNTPDRIRGDLDIQPIKIGYFDVSTVPQIDLSKGYFGYYNDIEQTQDLQDIAYQKTRDTDGGDTMQSTQKLDRLLTALNQDMMKPKAVYATPPPLNFGPIKNESNPWYNNMTNTVNTAFAKA